ncbi:hypothetical protein [Paenibacillus monticola]|uniref:Uncharacterized protein n=1 Tax=Paenibacillus monticola TaxID=2666075 RepID=A0A7X2L1U9_9BACL|nr:hypothetical protein [Paenibacillus monticola]MRN53530.1 hypothetical protein [Paenibacillus monticola]
MNILHFFIPRERTLIYTTFDQAQFFKVKGNLLAAGIRHRSKIEGGTRGTTHRAFTGGKLQQQHCLYVCKEDEHRALPFIR